MIAHETIESWLVGWFKKNSLAPISDIQELLNANYFEKGLIDSFKFITLIMAIEEEFRINFSNDEFQNRSFSTITGLTQIIADQANKKCV